MAVAVSKLDAVQLASKTTGGHNPCHVYGILLYEESITDKQNFWNLADFTCSSGVKIKLYGDISTYPRPKPGDVIRIHRLHFERNTGLPYVPVGRNVVVWRSFQNDDTPITTARNPTYTDEDITIRKELELFFNTNLITPFDCIKNVTMRGNTNYFNVAGRVDSVELVERYGNVINLEICDATERLNLRVYGKTYDRDDDTHFQTASDIAPGQLIIATNVKFRNPNFLDLSANTKLGKWIRKVDVASSLGQMISSKFASLAPPTTQSDPHNQASDSQINNNNNVCHQQANHETSQREMPSIQSIPIQSMQMSRTLEPAANQSSPPPRPIDVIKVYSDKSDDNSSRGEFINNNNNNNINELPKYTKLSSIHPTDGYQHYDIAGQVRGHPNQESMYGNCFFQLFDGSKPSFRFHYAEFNKEPIDNCATILVYSNQKPTDTNQHIEAAKKLKEGDLVHIKNIKASWKNQRCKLEMNANLLHGKCIKVIERDSEFGISLAESCSYPDIEELTEQPSLNSQDLEP